MITTWDIPTSLEEAEDRRRALIAEVSEIETQLGDRTRSRDEEYWAWRQKAKWAKTNRLQELRLVKQWIKKERGPINEFTQLEG